MWCADDNNHHMLVLRPKNRILWSSIFCLRLKSQWSIDYVYMMMNLRITASVSFHIIYIWHIAMIMCTIITVASHSVQLNPKKCNWFFLLKNVQLFISLYQKSTKLSNNSLLCSNYLYFLISILFWSTMKPYSIIFINCHLIALHKLVTRFVHKVNKKFLRVITLLLILSQKIKF